jgi:pimeloyl-ACP methyl ester carboxylesterase
LLLAHGAGGTIQANFGPLIAPLARTFTVIGPDYPGSGKTERATTPLTLDELADRLVATAVAQGAEKFAVVGYSLGCTTAVRAATRHPDRVTGLVLTAGFAALDESTRGTSERWRTLASGDRKVLAKFVMSVVLSEAYDNRMSDVERGGFEDLIAATLPKGLVDQIDLVLKADVREDLPKVAVPTLVIGMELDRLIPMRLSKDLADGIPGAQWATLQSGHATSLEVARDWLRLIEGFLA